MWRRMVAPLMVIVLVTGFVAVLHHLGVGRVFTPENIEVWRSMVRRAGLWAPLMYLALCVIAIVLMSPATPLLVVAAMFGVFWGIVWGSAGITLGAGAAFLVARHAGRSLLRKLAGHTREFQRIEDGVRRYGWQMVMLTRIVPIFPFNIQNFAYGLTSIRFRTYLFFTWLCTLPAVIAYVMAAGALISGRSDPRRIALYLVGGAPTIAALILVPRYIWRKRDLPVAQFLKEEQNLRAASESDSCPKNH